MSHIDKLFEKIGNDIFIQLCKKMNIMNRDQLLILANHIKHKYPLLWKYHNVDGTERNENDLDDIEQ
jgi:hypothetical protein